MTENEEWTPFLAQVPTPRPVRIDIQYLDERKQQLVEVHNVGFLNKMVMLPTGWRSVKQMRKAFWRYSKPKKEN